MNKKGRLIEECITEDFDIYIGSDNDMIRKYLYIQSLYDVKENKHLIKFMYWNKEKDNICVHKDDKYYKSFQNMKEAKNHFKNLNYKLSKKDEYIAKSGCFVEKYQITKNKENQNIMDEDSQDINNDTGEYGYEM